jgi:hypothetical protein
VRIEITDVAGRIVLQRNFFHTDLVQLQLDEPFGLYFLNIRADGKKVTVKLAKDKRALQWDPS